MSLRVSPTAATCRCLESQAQPGGGFACLRWCEWCGLAPPAQQATNPVPWESPSTTACSSGWVVRLCVGQMAWGGTCESSFRHHKPSDTTHWLCRQPTSRTACLRVWRSRCTAPRGDPRWWSMRRIPIIPTSATWVVQRWKCHCDHRASVNLPGACDVPGCQRFANHLRACESTTAVRSPITRFMSTRCRPHCGVRSPGTSDVRTSSGTTVTSTKW